LEKKNEPAYEEDEEEEKTKTQIRIEKKREKQLIQEERDKRKEILALEDEIEKFEAKLGVLDAEFSNPNLYDNPQNIVELTRKREEIQFKLDNYYNQWIKLTE
ncbi:MAG: thiamine ABC transporter substrate-binding protein, partial [Tissierellia bacterium]|nr:thiamine ABC transporter substrate-binding protein [Tissierellia bacterium]